MTTGEIIKQARHGFGWTQEKLANEAKISRNSLSRIENGDTINMAAFTAVNIAKALGISLDVLLCPDS